MAGRLGTYFAIVMGCALSAVVHAAQDEQRPGEMDHGSMVELAERISPSLVRVEWTLKYDRGEAPYIEGLWERGGYVIDEERPLEEGGYLLGPALVVTKDPAIHARFIDKVEVRFGDQVVSARMAGYQSNQRGVLLQLAEPLDGARPLEFVPAGDDSPLFHVNYTNSVTWDIAVNRLMPRSTIAFSTELKRATIDSMGPLVINAEGKAVALHLVDRLPLETPWASSPLDRPQVSSAELSHKLDELRGRVEETLLRVTINFRSPKAQDDGMGGRMMYGRGQMDSATEWNGIGMLLEPDRLLVLAKLKPSVTARLERIRVATSDGRSVAATFVGSLKDYGAFIAQLDEPISGSGVSLDEAPILTHRDELLLAAQVRIQGESREVFYQHERLSGFHLGWNRQVHPDYAPDFPTFLYTLDGTMIAAPISRREKVTIDDGWGWHSSALLAAENLRRTLDRGDDAFDVNNIPLADGEESRLAWLGVEMQALDMDLARAIGVANLTNDGTTGGIVTFIYPESPAERSGLQVNDVLIRLHVEGQPRPLDVMTEGDRWAFQGGFPWDRWDELPEEYFDQIPTPWAAVESGFVRALTDLGFGTRYQAEVVRDGEVMMLDFLVEQSPAHYVSAPKFESEALGITVKDLTYEVRRYLQRPIGEPGVVIAKVEPGSKASIAGIKPYEVITHINDQPVHDVSEFEQRIQGLADFRFEVKRMMRGRIVRVLLDESIGGAAEVKDDVDHDDGEER